MSRSSRELAGSGWLGTAAAIAVVLAAAPSFAATRHAPPAGHVSATAPHTLTSSAAAAAGDPVAAVHDTATGARAAAAETSGSAGYTLKGGSDGTVFQSLTVEAEDRVHVDFDRPELKVDLDEDHAPGLEWGSARDVLDRTEPDLMAPLAGMSSREMSVYLGRPWLGTFASGPVARFRPDVQGVERWRLLVADSHGQTVATFAGNGRPEHEIEWDGRTTTGALVTPGLTYSYVFEAFDRAGNKRNFVGPGFTVPAYRIDTAEGPVLTFGGASLAADPTATGPAAMATPAILLESASWLNQSERLTRPIRVTVTARSAEQAQALADRTMRTLGPLVLGDPARLRRVTIAQPDAPEGGTITIAPEATASR
jgi:hypothetical protein